MASLRRAWWFLAAALIATAAFSGGTYAESTVAQDPCADAVGSLFGGIPDLGGLFGSGVSGPGVNMNSGNNISIQMGPDNITPGQSSSVGNNDSRNSNNVSTCCVSTDGGPPTCTP